MCTKELRTGNYMEALLRASLLLGDRHRSVPIREITIAAYDSLERPRHLYPSCKIISSAHAAPPLAPPGAHVPPGESYLILYPR